MRTLRTIWIGVAAAVFAATNAFPARAYDALSEVVRHVPEAPEGGVGEFYFMSPAAMAGWPPQSWIGVGYNEFDDALLDRAVGIETVGIDFTAAEGIAHWGTPPFQLLYIIGDTVDEDDVREALLARGLEEVERDEVAVFTIGDDRAVDLAARDPGYPFGGGWRAHRVAVSDGVALLAFAWPDLDVGIAAARLNGDGAVQAMLDEMVWAASEAAPDGFVAHGAATLPTSAYVSPEEAADGAAAPLPSFEAVLYIAAAGDDWEAVQIALAYTDPGEAIAAAEDLAIRLQGFPGVADLDAKVMTGTVPRSGSGATAVVTVLFPPRAADHPSSQLYYRMISDAMSRRLQLIAVSPE